MMAPDMPSPLLLKSAAVIDTSNVTGSEPALAPLKVNLDKALLKSAEHGHTSESKIIPKSSQHHRRSPLKKKACQLGRIFRRARLQLGLGSFHDRLLGVFLAVSHALILDRRNLQGRSGQDQCI